MFNKTSNGLLGVLIFTGLLYSCGGKEETTQESESQKNVDSTLMEEGYVSNVWIPFKERKINPDSILKPTIVEAGEPIFQRAHQNIRPVDEPILQLVSRNLPTFIIGEDSIKQPIVTEATGTIKNSGYNEPVSSSKYDFNDGASYNIQGIDVDQGLSSSYVMDIIEDKRGNLWFATWTAGVTMYNGRSFIMFDENKGMRSNYVWTIYEDSNGNIWFGTDGYGASFYDGHKFNEFDDGSALNDHLVFDITGDDQGNVWLGTDQGAIRYDGNNFYRYGIDQGLSGERVKSIIVAENGDVWMAIEGQGINKFDGSKVTHYTTDEGLISNNVSVIFEDSEENLWIGTEESGVCFFDGYSFITYQEEMGLPYNTVKSILEDTQGNMWLGTEGGGAAMFNRFEFRQFSSAEGMSNNNILSLLEDSDGNIWFGTWGAGANVYNERSFENYTENQGLNDHIIRYIIQDYEGYVWFSSNRGISKYDGKNFWHYTEEQGLSNNVVRNMLIDQNGDFWLGTQGSGVMKFDGETFTYYDSESGLSGDFILSMFEDSEGNLWFGTYGGGVTKFDGQRFSHLTMDEGLPDNTIHSIVEDTSGVIYFGSKVRGVTKYDGENIFNIGIKEGLPEWSAISMHVASDGTLWVGSEGYGLSNVIESEDTIIVYNLDGGNSHNIIWSITEDDNGDLWLGTERGLNNFSVDTNGVTVTNYGKLDGLQGSDFYPNSACLDDENRIWWGTGKALAMLDLNKYQQNQNAPSIQITDVRLEQTFIDYRKLKDTLESGHPYYLDEDEEIDLSSIKFNDVTEFTNCPDKLELPYYLNHLTFYFSGIDWSAPHKVRYQYKLQGLDKGWRPVTEENWAVYSNTPSGEYIFKVRAIGDAKVWSEELSYPVIIHPPWWTTWWAYILYGLIGLVALIIYIRVRTAKLLQNKKQLEETVNLRTSEVVHQKELVEKKNQEIMDSITYAQRIQNAILPSKNLIDKHLNEAFFIYQPKDIVAGDFYWLENQGDTILLAAADCTGHGVPGAMVSVVCNNALNRTVREFNLHSPAEILNKVRELVIETFTTADAEVKDGMDIALISLNLKTLELKYAGANNNLYIISDGQLQEIQADKMPIGRYIVNKDFKEHKFQLKQGDQFYIYTDGYMDQFGGPKGKKFKYSAFKEMLVEIHDQSMDDQGRYLVSTISQWMGDTEQIDDICVIGVRV